MLRISNLKKDFDKKEILNGVNLEINDGSIFGLVGINGAGKSTLLRCIAGVYNYQEGHILLNDKDTYLDEEVRKDLIFVSDEPYLPSTSNLNNLIEYYKAFYDLDEDVVKHYVDLLKLNPKQNFSSYSKGMKRQASLIMAIAIKPKLIMLDEMFDGLDPLVRLIFKKALINLVEENKTTIIISSHNLKELEDICDHFGILENGVITTSGDLIESKENINKYQLAFEDIKTRDDFKDFEVLHFSNEGRVITMVIKGDEEEVTQKLNKLKPLLLDNIPVNFEELFIYEMEARGEYYE